MAKRSHLSAPLITPDEFASPWEVDPSPTPPDRDRLTTALDTAGALAILGGLLVGVATIATLLEIGTWTEVTTWAVGTTGALLMLGAALLGFGEWRYRRVNRG